MSGKSLKSSRVEGLRRFYSRGSFDPGSEVTEATGPGGREILLPTISSLSLLIDLSNFLRSGFQIASDLIVLFVTKKMSLDFYFNHKDPPLPTRTSPCLHGARTGPGPQSSLLTPVPPPRRISTSSYLPQCPPPRHVLLPSLRWLLSPLLSVLL